MTLLIMLAPKIPQPGCCLLSLSPTNPCDPLQLTSNCPTRQMSNPSHAAHQ